MKNIVFGLICYIVFLIIGLQNFNIIEALILLSILLFVPTSFRITNMRKRDGSVLPVAKLVVFLYPIAASSAMLAFITEHTVFAFIWLIYTCIIALLGISRLLERGWRPASETAIDSGFIYLALGGFWLFAAVADIQIMHFNPLIILLTAAHFHYSAFLIPICAGLLGRMQERSIVYTIITWIIIVSPMTIAIGITYSTTIEFLAVLIYLIALYGYGIFVWKTKFRRRSAKVLLVISVSTLMITIIFSLIYAYGNFQQTMTITIDRMVWIHGVANGIGVALPAFLGWIIERRSAAYEYYGKPMSQIYGKMKISEEFLRKNDLLEKKEYTGLVNDMKEYRSRSFDERNISPIIRDFYENTKQYELKAYIQWSRAFKPFAFLYERISRHVQQIHLGMGGHLEKMHGDIVGIYDEKDGRQDVRAWVRKNEKNETIFVALYSTHSHSNEVYMNIALPLPYMNMTGILKLKNKDEDLIITSKFEKNRLGDEGIYLHNRFFTVRLPLTETFMIQAKKDMKLVANHEMWIFGMKFLEINYEIERT
ncbi:membrane protein [Bacillus manliponensis]|uniref:Membrane protein n=1 Tax=Bacillus manliponensis TaxID=574376 RepID=A0A073K2N8_9BACI|nr:YndJ family protein [Bacillus manliponensis]KEK20722.1 membrane protein [Bacillus manliponensis]